MKSANSRMRRVRDILPAPLQLKSEFCGAIVGILIASLLLVGCAAPKKLEENTRQLQMGSPEHQHETSGVETVSLAVTESEESRRIREEARWNLERPEDYSDSSYQSDQCSGMALYFILTGPFALIMEGACRIDEAIEETRSAREENARLAQSLEILVDNYAQSDPKGDFEEILLASAAKHRAPDFLVSDTDNAADNASHYLEIELEGIRLIADQPGRARLLGTAQARLATQNGNTTFEKRYCYGIPMFSIKEVAEDTGKLREKLSNVYQSLSSQILTEGLGLPADDNLVLAWTESEKHCKVTVKITGGSYEGEMKDGMRHGNGEMQYKPPKDWVLVYRGPFVNNKEHGIGRCRWASGGWSKCAFENGLRKHNY